MKKLMTRAFVLWGGLFIMVLGYVCGQLTNDTVLNHVYSVQWGIGLGMIISGGIWGFSKHTT